MSCTKCRLHSTCLTVKIDGRGNKNPKYMFIGEAPGAEEDERGKVFVGDSGRLLAEAITEYDLKPCFISNIVRCRPPGNRAPKADEIKACQPYLMEEIKRVKPEIIVTMGNHALKVITGKSGVMNYAGREVGNLNGSKVFSLYHPAFVIRYPKNKYNFEAHLKALKHFGEGNKQVHDHKVEILTPKEACHILRQEKNMVTFDFETNGKYLQYGGRILCCGFHANDKTFVVEAGKDDFDKLMKWFLESEVKKCCHNGIFERRWAIDKWGIEPRNLVFDTYLMHYLIDENARHGLDSAAAQFLGITSWDIAPLMVENKWEWGDIPFPDLAKYCGLDCFYTHRLFFSLTLKMEEKLQKFYDIILLPLSILCSRLESRGLKVDSSYAEKIEKKYREDCENLKYKMKKLVGLSDKFNPGSSAHLSKVLNKLKINTGEKTEGGKMSVKKDAVNDIKDKHPFIPIYLQWREKRDAINNYLCKYPQLVDVRSIIHPNFNPAFQVTSRISVSNPSAQNVPRNPEIRGMIVSRFENGMLLSCDYNQLEMRLVASESGEQRLIELFKAGRDPHDETAEQLFGKEFTDNQRAIAKNINFGTIYGISSWSLSKKFHVSEEIASLWMEKFRKAYPNLSLWMREQHKFVKKNGWLESRFGQKRRFPEIISADDYDTARILRQAGNFPIQALGAAITNQAALRCDKKISEGLLVHIIHDALLFDVENKWIEKVKSNTRYVMEEEIKIVICPWLKVDLKVTQEVSKRWGGEDYAMSIL